jgi:hypothetical protein
MTRRARLIFIEGVLVLAFATACSTAKTVRTATYAPSFSYIEKEKLSSAMWRMADDVAALDALVRGAPADQVPQQEVVRLLEDIHGAASGLQAPDGESNHPMLDKNLGDFLREVESAKAAASATPPSYFLAGSVTGACVHCHAGRGPGG